METWSILRSLEGAVQLLRLSDSRYKQPHWILVTRRIRSECFVESRQPPRDVEARIELEAIYVGGPLHGRACRVADFGGQVLAAGSVPVVKITTGYVHVDDQLRGLGLGSFLFNEVIVWAQSMKLLNARVQPISLRPGGELEEHRRAARFYRRFGIDTERRGDGPPSSDPELQISDLKRWSPPEKTIVVTPFAEGVEKMIRGLLEEQQNWLYARHGQEVWKLVGRIDLLHRIAIVGWGALVAVGVGLITLVKSVPY